MGYLFGRARNLNYRLYTHLCHAFIVADGDGALRPNQNVPSRELTTEAHKNGVKVLVSLGGWGWDKQFASIVSKPVPSSGVPGTPYSIIGAQGWA